MAFVIRVKTYKHHMSSKKKKHFNENLRKHAISMLSNMKTTSRYMVCKYLKLQNIKAKNY